jgi:hypothetical protein
VIIIVVQKIVHHNLGSKQPKLSQPITPPRLLVVDSLISSISRKTTKVSIHLSEVILVIIIIQKIVNHNLGPKSRKAEATAAASASDNPSGFSVFDSLTYSISRKTSIDS